MTVERREADEEETRQIWNIVELIINLMKQHECKPRATFWLAAMGALDTQLSMDIFESKEEFLHQKAMTWDFYKSKPERIRFTEKGQTQ